MSKTPSFESQFERKLPKFHNGRRFDPVSESVEFNLSGNRSAIDSSSILGSQMDTLITPTDKLVNQKQISASPKNNSSQNPLSAQNAASSSDNCRSEGYQENSYMDDKSDGSSSPRHQY